MAVYAGSKRYESANCPHCGAPIAHVVVGPVEYLELEIARRPGGWIESTALFHYVARCKSAACGWETVVDEFASAILDHD